ncbi:MAG TPA: hypothetical protein VLC48_05585 [Gemmatimonadota bacterium]|nr:hypothetical protein [Gemmatimonadota bacterium]
MKLPRSLVVALLAGALVCLAAAAQAPDYRLQLSDRVGQISRYRLAFDLDMRAEYKATGTVDDGLQRLIGALEEGMIVRTAVEYDERLVAVDPDGARTFDVRWHDYQFQGQIGDKPIPEPPGRAEATRDLLAASAARVRTDPTGRTLAVEYSNSRARALVRQFEQAGVPTYLPEIPVRVGDSWTGRASFPLGTGLGVEESMELDLVHTLSEVRQGPSGPVAVIGISGSYSRLQGIENVGLGSPLHMEASLTGSSLFNLQEGRFVGGQYEIDMFALHATPEVEVQLVGHARGKLELLEAP